MFPRGATSFERCKILLNMVAQSYVPFLDEILGILTHMGPTSRLPCFLTTEYMRTVEIRARQASKL